MASQSKVEKELLSATKQKERGKKESPNEYLIRIAQAVEGLSDGNYQELSEESQAWFTQAAEALSEDPPNPEGILPFDAVVDADEAEAEASEPEDEAEETTGTETEETKEVEEEKPAKSSKTKAAKPAAAAKKAPTAKPTPAPTKKEVVKKGPPKRENSIANAIRLAMCKDPTLTKDGVAKVLKEQRLSFDQSRLDQIFSFTSAVLKILQDLKKLK